MTVIDAPPEARPLRMLIREVLNPLIETAIDEAGSTENEDMIAAVRKHYEDDSEFLEALRRDSLMMIVPEVAASIAQKLRRHVVSFTDGTFMPRSMFEKLASEPLVTQPLGANGRPKPAPKVEPTGREILKELLEGTGTGLASILSRNRVQLLAANKNALQRWETESRVVQLRKMLAEALPNDSMIAGELSAHKMTSIVKSWKDEAQAKGS